MSTYANRRHGAPANDNFVPVSAILIEALRILSAPFSWIHQGPMATDMHDIEVAPNSPYAVAWDSAGATERAAHNLGAINDHGTNADRYLLEVGGGELFNDHPDTTHQMVLDKFRLAIARAQIVEAGNEHAGI